MTHGDKFMTKSESRRDEDASPEVASCLTGKRKQQYNTPVSTLACPENSLEFSACAATEDKRKNGSRESAHLGINPPVFDAPLEPPAAAAKLLLDTMHLAPVGCDNAHPDYPRLFPVYPARDSAVAAAGGFDPSAAPQTGRHEARQERGDEGRFPWVLVRVPGAPLGAGRYIDEEERRKARPERGKSRRPSRLR